jgi:hypothetical protein
VSEIFQTYPLEKLSRWEMPLVYKMKLCVQKRELKKKKKIIESKNREERNVDKEKED